MIPSATSANGNFPMMSVFLLIVVYAFFAYCLSRIAQRANRADHAWWAWLPILQVLLVLEIASLEWWWIILFLIPFVNIAIAIYVWVRVAKALSKHPVWGVLMIVPGIDIFVLAYLAFSK